MRGDVVYSSEAMKDVQGIAEWIGKDNLNAALRVIDEIDAVLKLLVKFPEAAEDVDRIFPNTRRTTSGSYVIYYRRRGQDINVVRVVHGARDIGEIHE